MNKRNVKWVPTTDGRSVCAHSPLTRRSVCVLVWQRLSTGRAGGPRCRPRRSPPAPPPAPWEAAARWAAGSACCSSDTQSAYTAEQTHGCWHGWKTNTHMQRPYTPIFLHIVRFPSASGGRLFFTFFIVGTLETLVTLCHIKLLVCVWMNVPFV